MFVTLFFKSIIDRSHHTRALQDVAPCYQTAVSSLMVVAYIFSFDVLDVLREVQR